MEKLPDYWAVINDGSHEFRDNVIRYIISQSTSNVDINSLSLTRNTWAGKHRDGFFTHLTHEEIVDRRKEVTVLPLHLFKQLIDNEKKITQRRKQSRNVSGTIIGYTLKSGVSNEAALRALGVNETEPMFRNIPSIPIAFEVNTTLHKAAVSAGLLDLLFEPQYRRRNFTVIVRHDNGHLVASIVNGVVTIDGQRFSTIDIKQLLAPIVVRGHSFTPTKFTGGCDNQYQGISRDDIQQVLDQMLPF